MAPQPQRPLDLVQIDHTPIDLIVVDEVAREPIGRPYLTLAIDVFSRCVVGMVVTLEAPSATSVGLCLAHAVTDKRPWLERLGIEADWPMTGMPRAIHLDNASEFRSEALHRGCEQYGIARHYRAAGRYPRLLWGRTVLYRTRHRSISTFASSSVSNTSPSSSSSDSLPLNDSM